MIILIVPIYSELCGHCGTLLSLCYTPFTCTRLMDTSSMIDDSDLCRGSQPSTRFGLESSPQHISFSSCEVGYCASKAVHQS
jgi:hypothetical protein